MKRSEMVAEIALRFKYIYGYGLEESKALADDLLSLCEYKGMRPPVSDDLDAQMRAARLNKRELEDTRSDNADFKSSNCDNNNGPCACGAWHETK